MFSVYSAWYEFIPDFCGLNSPRQVLTLKCDKLTFETRSTLSFDFTGGACSANDNRIVLCFPKQNRKQCYKSRSPIPEHWWQFLSTGESIYGHNFTAVALSSYNKPGTFHVANLVLKLVEQLETTFFLLWAVMNMHKRSSSTFQPGTGENPRLIWTIQRFTHLQLFSINMNSTS